VFSVNVKGTFYCYKYAAQQMIAQGDGGRIIGASSLAGKKGKSTQWLLCLLDLMFPLGHAFLSAYCASKFAVRGLTQSAGTVLCSLTIISASIDHHFFQPLNLVAKELQ